MSDEEKNFEHVIESVKVSLPIEGRWHKSLVHEALNRPFAIYFRNRHAKNIRPVVESWDRDAGALARTFDFTLEHYIGPVEGIRIIKHANRVLNGFSLKFDIEMVVADRDDQHGVRAAHFVYEWDFEIFERICKDRPRFPEEEIRRLILEAHRHELDECLYVKGKRVFDPHEGDPK